MHFDFSFVGAVLAWLGLAVVVYVYLGYPLALWVLGRIARRAVGASAGCPRVTLMISAFNEADVIAAKLENSLQLDYPRDRLKIVVISDASDDATDRIVASYSGKGVQLIRMAERGGKTVGLNAAMTTVSSDIVVFSDANIMYRTDTVQSLVAPFADPQVGCVTGDSQYAGENPSAAHIQENTYWGYERWIRTLESQIGSTVGGDGAIFAIRRSLFQALSPDAINDLVIPLQIVSKGYRAVFASTAVGYEPSAGDFTKEFRRKRRIVNRSWRGVWSVPGVLNPFRMGIFAWQVWSHKVLRWLVLFFVCLGVMGCVLAMSRSWIYQLGTWGFVGSMALAAMGAVAPSTLGLIGRLAQGMFYFYLVNVAALLGIMRAIFGRVEMIWAPERS